MERKGKQRRRAIGLALLLCCAVLAAGRAGSMPEPVMETVPEPVLEPAKAPPRERASRREAPEDGWSLPDVNLRVGAEDGTKIGLLYLPDEDGVYSLLDVPHQAAAFPPGARFSVAGDDLDAYRLEIWAEMDGVGELVEVKEGIGNGFSLPEKSGTYGVTLTLRWSRCGFVAAVGNGQYTDERPGDPLPYYLYLQDPKAYFSREDWGVEYYAGPEAAETLIGLELEPWTENARIPPLDVPHDFTLSYRFGRREDVFRFTPEGVFFHEKRYIPGHPEALSILYENEAVKRILDAEAYRLGDRMGFGVGDVQSVTVHRMETLVGEETVRLSSRQAVDMLTGLFAEATVRNRIEGVYDSLFTANGSWAVDYYFDLGDGRIWHFYDGPSNYYLDPDGVFTEVEVLEPRDFRTYDSDLVDFFGKNQMAELAGSYAPARPILTAAAGEASVEAEVRSYDYGDVAWISKYGLPGHRRTGLHVSGDGAFTFQLRDSPGNPIEPEEVQACSIRWAHQEELRKELPVEGNLVRLTNPDTEVLLRVRLREGTVEYLVRCTSADETVSEDAYIQWTERNEKWSDA